jgi:hypothetical protein
MNTYTDVTGGKVLICVAKSTYVDGGIFQKELRKELKVVCNLYSL